MDDFPAPEAEKGRHTSYKLVAKAGGELAGTEG